MQRIKDAFNIATKKEKNRGTLWASVQARRIIEFYYHGGYRTVEPYALGITRHGEADNESLICYQLSGFSELNDATGWKMYRISEMEDIRVSREQFTGDRPGYDPENIIMDQVFYCIPPVKPMAVEVKEEPVLSEIVTPLGPASPAESASPPESASPSETEYIPEAPVPQPVDFKTSTHNEMMQRFRLFHAIHG